MTKAKIYLFNNRFTGEVLPLTKAQGKKLNEDWSRIKPATNEKGERVLRMKMNNGTVDIKETKVAQDGNPGAE